LKCGPISHDIGKRGRLYLDSNFEVIGVVLSVDGDEVVGPDVPLPLHGSQADLSERFQG